MPKTSPAPALINRRTLVGLGIVGGAMAFVGWRHYATAPFFAGDSLRVQDAYAAAQAGAITLVDIRRPDEWRRTGVGLGAHPIDMRRDDFLAALADFAGQSRDAPIGLICARGVRSARLANQLSKAGYTNIINVPEGMEGSAAGPGWVGARLPLVAYEGPET